MVKIAVFRSRLQFLVKEAYERPLVVEVAPEATVLELKRLIFERQKKLSTGEERGLHRESPIAVEPGAQLLVLRKDAKMRQVVLEDPRPLKDYGIHGSLEKNLFLRRTTTTGTLEILLIDTYYLTPSQQDRLDRDLQNRDYHGYRRTQVR